MSASKHAVFVIQQRWRQHPPREFKDLKSSESESLIRKELAYFQEHAEQGNGSVSEYRLLKREITETVLDA